MFEINRHTDKTINKYKSKPITDELCIKAVNHIKYAYLFIKDNFDLDETNHELFKRFRYWTLRAWIETHLLEMDLSIELTQERLVKKIFKETHKCQREESKNKRISNMVTNI